MEKQSTLLLPPPGSFPHFGGASATVRDPVPVPGGWVPIKDVTDPHVQEIAKWAVEEHNKEAGTHLKYDHVNSGETQVVAGVNYRLRLVAKNGDNPKMYQTVVYEKVWEGYRQLIYFKPKFLSA